MSAFQIAASAAVANLALGVYHLSPLNVLVALLVGVALWADRS